MTEQEYLLRMKGRNTLYLQGVLGVDTTTEQKIVLQTTLGDMVIIGKNLHISHLDLTAEEAEFGGVINSIAYPENPLKGRKKKSTAKHRKFFLKE